MVDHSIGGDADNLAESFEHYLPNVRIARIDRPERFRWSGTLVKRSGRHLWRVRSNAEWDFRTSAAIKHTVFLSMPTAGGLKVTDSEGERLVGPGQALVLHVPDDRDNLSYCDGEHARTSLKWSLGEATRALSSIFDTIPLDTLPPIPVLDLSDDRGQVIRRLLGAIARDISCPQSSSTLASELMSEAALRLIFEPQLCRADERAHRTTSAIVPRAVKQAIDYMRANAGEPIRIRDVADACCVTPRTLENGFREFKGTTPVAFLRHLRLQAVRHELMTSDGPVRISEIAHRWGFVDLGRFAERYRRTFGERPSQTLRRR